MKLLKAVFWIFIFLVIVGAFKESDDEVNSGSGNVTSNNQQSALHRMVNGDVSNNDNRRRDNVESLNVINPNEFLGKDIDVNLRYTVAQNNFVTVKGESNLPPYTIFALYIRRGEGIKASMDKLMVDKDGNFNHTFEYDFTQHNGFIYPTGGLLNIQFLTLSSWQNRLRDKSHRSYPQANNIMRSLESMNGVEFSPNSVIQTYRFSEEFPFDESTLR